jgi:hypothetical protein
MFLEQNSVVDVAQLLASTLTSHTLVNGKRGGYFIKGFRDGTADTKVISMDYMVSYTDEIPYPYDMYIINLVGERIQSMRDRKIQFTSANIMNNVALLRNKDSFQDDGEHDNGLFSLVLSSTELNSFYYGTKKIKFIDFNLIFKLFIKLN